MLQRLVAETDVEPPDVLARQRVLLMEGAVVTTQIAGHARIARQAKTAAATWLQAARSTCRVT